MPPKTITDGTSLYYYNNVDKSWNGFTQIQPIRFSDRTEYRYPDPYEKVHKAINEWRKNLEESKFPTFILDKESSVEIMNNINNNNNKSIMPNIVDYKWNAETGTTYIKWSDKTETTVRAEDPATADQFVGFMMCYAKRAAGNTSRINNLYDKWAVRKPIQDKKAEAKALAEKKEKDRIASKRKKEREEYLIYREALRIKRDYEARKLANEKFGVPMEDMG